MITLDILKYGKRHCVTTSWDDGNANDRPLIEMFNKYGIKGTFHLNSGHYARPDNAIKGEELPTLYAGHEIACHGVRHSSMTYLDPTAIYHEIFADRIALERYAGYPVRGLSYANGKYTEDNLAPLAACGIVYSRTTRDTRRYEFPTNFLEWHPTTHQRNAVMQAEDFMQAIDGYYSGPKLLYVWGHSHEFERMVKWSEIEQFCRMVSGNEKIWYATNIEIYDYMQAQRALVLSADHTMVYNPSAMEVWFSCDGEICSVKPGEMWKK